MNILTSLIWSALALAIVVALILLAGRLVRLRGPGCRSGGARLVAVASLSVDARRRLHLIECDGRRVLLLTGRGEAMIALDPSP